MVENAAGELEKNTPGKVPVRKKIGKGLPLRERQKETQKKKKEEKFLIVARKPTFHRSAG